MKKSFSWILKLSITSGILYYIFTAIPLSEVLKTIASAKMSYIVIALFIHLFTIYLEAYRMKILTDKQGMSLTIFQIVEINLVTGFYGLFLPGYLVGGAIRLYKFSKPENKWTEALASMTFNRLIGTIVLVVVGISFWMFDSKSKSNYLVGLSLFFVLIILLTAHLLVFDGKASGLLRKFGCKFKLSIFPEMARTRFSKLAASTSQFHSLSRSLMIYICSLSVTSNLLGVLSFYLFSMSLGIDLSIVNIGWVRSFIVIIAMLPVSFAGLGVREGALVFLLQPYGVPATAALALSFLLLARTLLLGGIGGLFEANNLFLPGRSKSKVKEEIST